jgi:hypothetical protein
MTRPGDRVRRLATRVCTERTRRRLIDPALADLQSEFAAARRAGSAWRTWWALGAGYLSIAKVLTIAVCGDLRTEASTWEPAERAGALQGALLATAVTVVATALLIGQALTGTGWTQLAIYLVPSTIAVTAPLGLALGTAWTLHGAARTRKLAVAAVMIATICSVGMFVNVGWLTPEANQAFRERAMPPDLRGGRALPRGVNELTLPALRAEVARERIFGRPQRARFFSAVYYQRFANTLAPLPMIGVVLALAFRRRWNRLGLVTGTAGMCVAYFAVLMSIFYVGAVLGLPPIVIGWSATALCAVAAILITSFPSRARA